MKQRTPQDSLNDLVEGMAHCMQKAIDEEPEASKTWTPEELFEKGSKWAGCHCLIMETKE